MPASVVERLFGRTHGKEDEVVNLALLLRLHPLIGIEGAVRTVPAANLPCDFAGKIGDIEFLDSLNSALPREQALPRRLDPASERRHHTKTSDDDASHHQLSRLTLWPMPSR